MPALEVYERTTTRKIERHGDERVHLLTCTATDPFRIDDRCSNETGHHPIASCGAVVCVHCSKVFWQ